MTERPRNLAPPRGPSVWDKPTPPAGWTLEESERWCVGICGVTLALLGLRQRPRPAARFCGRPGARTRVVRLGRRAPRAARPPPAPQPRGAMRGAGRRPRGEGRAEAGALAQAE